MKNNTITCEFPHPDYGTLVLIGQYCPEEPDCGLQACAVLESILTYDGEEMLLYSNGKAVGFTSADIREMEEALLYRGEFSGRTAPSQQTLATVRLMLGLAPAVVVDGNVLVIDAAEAA